MAEFSFLIHLESLGVGLYGDDNSGAGITHASKLVCSGRGGVTWTPQVSLGRGVF